jgi:hypothetical protein
MTTQAVRTHVWNINDSVSWLSFELSGMTEKPAIGPEKLFFLDKYQSYTKRATRILWCRVAASINTLGIADYFFGDSFVKGLASLAPSIAFLSSFLISGVVKGLPGDDFGSTDELGIGSSGVAGLTINGVVGLASGLFGGVATLPPHALNMVLVARIEAKSIEFFIVFPQSSN